MTADCVLAVAHNTLSLDLFRHSMYMYVMYRPKCRPICAVYLHSWIFIGV